MHVIYEGVLFPPDAKGLSGCSVFGIPANGSGTSPAAALHDAATIMQKAIDDLVRDGSPVPGPEPVPADLLALGQPVAIMALVPGAQD